MWSLSRGLIQDFKGRAYLQNVRLPSCRSMLLGTIFVILIAAPAFIRGNLPETNNSETPPSGNEWTDFWVFRITLNLLSYATVIVPGYLIIRFVRNSKYLDTASELGGFCFPPIYLLKQLELCVKKCHLLDTMYR